MPGTGFEVEPKTLSHPSQLELSLDNSKFCAYHEANPHLYKKFEELTLQTIAKGFKNYGSKGIVELIRWHTGISSNGDVFKVSNQYTAFYARLFEKLHPEHKGFFRKKKSKFDE
jgi:hypothetical protein